MKKLLLFLLILITSTLTTYAQKELWGLTYQGGEYNAGTIFNTYQDGSNHQIVHELFKYTGRNPRYAKLCEADNGRFYGMTRSGGSNDNGVLFEFDPVTGTYTNKFDFDGASKGRNPYGSLMQASNGKLYGMTRNGGSNGYGVLFEFDPATGTYTKKLDFDGRAKEG